MLLIETRGLMTARQRTAHDHTVAAGWHVSTDIPEISNPSNCLVRFPSVASCAQVGAVESDGAEQEIGHSLTTRNAVSRYVLWSRIDQKTCLKAIVSANLVPVVIEPVLCGDELQTDTAAITAKLAELGPENVTCIVTTTSCFAPRSCDDVRLFLHCASVHVHDVS